MLSADYGRQLGEMLFVAELKLLLRGQEGAQAFAGEFVLKPDLERQFRVEAGDDNAQPVSVAQLE